VSLLATVGRRKAFAAEKLNYICWEGYNAPEIIDPFESKNNVKVEFDFITDSAGAFAKLAAGAWRSFDVISSDVPWIQRMGQAGIVEYLPIEDMGDLNSELFDQFKQPFSPLLHEGNTCGIPTRWGWVGPNINLDYSTEEEWRTLAPCFDSANRGKIGVMDWGDWPMMPVILYAGINPFEQLDDAALNECRKVFTALFKNTGAIVADMTLAQKGLLDGSMKTFLGCGNYCTSGLRKAGHMNITTIVPEPKDGLKQGVIWLEATAVVKDPADRTMAINMVKHMVSRDVAAKLAWTDWTCSPTTNRHFSEAMSEEQHEVIDTDYMWYAWDNSQTYNVLPNIDELLSIWQEELAKT
jgi:spermidine/putrescine transport system substrate-binding protein